MTLEKKVYEKHAPKRVTAAERYQARRKGGQEAVNAQMMTLETMG
jgi:hypothetical protein